MRGNEGFLALGTLVVVLLFFGLRGFDGEGRFNPTREAGPARFVTNEDGEQQIALRAGPGGHFFFEAEANGAPVRFMVDSGASVVTLTESDARRAGLRVEQGDYAVPFQTANGTVLAATGEVAELRIGGAVLNDLPVSVVPDSQLSGSLFGVNGLNRFDRYEVAGDRLVLTVD